MGVHVHLLPQASTSWYSCLIWREKRRGGLPWYGITPWHCSSTVSYIATIIHADKMSSLNLAF